MDTAMRLYSADELGGDGYPPEWHRGCILQDGVLVAPPAGTAIPPQFEIGIKHHVRDLAGHRCVRCHHPYRTGDERISEGGEWSRCDHACDHGGPSRVRVAGDDWRYIDPPKSGVPRGCHCGDCKNCRRQERRFRQAWGLPVRSPRARRPAAVSLPTDSDTLNYIAGLFDGEGSVIYSRRSEACVQRSIQVGMTDRDVIDWLGTIGGTVTERVAKPPRKALWNWRLAAHNDVIAFLTAVIPYLRVKRKDAERALAEITLTDDPVEVEAQWRILTVHHLDMNKANCRWWNLAALCQRCHLQIQGKVQMARVWPWEHSTWFRPYVAGYYASVYLHEELTREQTLERLNELLALERVA